MKMQTGPGEQDRDFDLNLAPIIDCLTVLITFLLASTAFLGVGFLDIIAPTPNPAAPAGAPPPITLEVELGINKDFQVKVVGKKNVNKTIAAAGGDWNLLALKHEIETIKKEFPETQSLVLNANDNVEYVHYIQVMEALRQQIPLVFLGGI